MKKRDISIDIIRILAITCVVSLHSLRLSMPLANGYGSEFTQSQIVASCLTGLSTLGVPLFLMISGYLMLGRSYTPESTMRLYKHNVLPMLVSFEFWNFFCTYILWKASGTFNFRQWMLSSFLLASPPMGHLWYMQSIVGAYLVIPLISFCLQSLMKQDFRCVLGVLGIVFFIYYSIIPTIKNILNIQNISTGIDIRMNLITIGYPTFVLYFLIGYAVRWYSKQIRLVKRRYILLFLLLSVVCLSSSVLWCNLHGNSFELGLMFTTVVFAATSLFILVWYICQTLHLGIRAKQCCEHLASYSYGIYCMHMPVMFYLNAKRDTLHMPSGWLLYIILFFLSFFLIFL